MGSALCYQAAVLTLCRCTASQQERPYISRPSRTQQLLNPKLAPKLKETKLADIISRHEGQGEDELRLTHVVLMTRYPRQHRDHIHAQHPSQAQTVSRRSLRIARGQQHHKDSQTMGDLAGDDDLMMMMSIDQNIVRPTDNHIR